MASRDPRLYQIGSLAALLAYGMGLRGFEVDPARALVLLGGCLITQWLCTRLFGLPSFEPKSALISGLSLGLLLRANATSVALLAAFLTIASKFALRVRGKHLFNPTNFGIVATILVTGEAWVSPGQWGNAAFFAFLSACCGCLVVQRAARSDVSFAFLCFWGALLFGRAARLGDPFSIPLHQLESGALLLFSFFMISDPKTTPDSRAGRIVFAALVAAGAYYVQFRLFRPNALLWSLAGVSPCVPLIDRLLPGCRYDWSAPRPGKDESHAPSSVRAVAGVEPQSLPA
jgi:Na+-transporting NADH:ubiquinone oxidoreductase subunit NqrB